MTDRSSGFSDDFNRPVWLSMELGGLALRFVKSAMKQPACCPVGGMLRSTGHRQRAEGAVSDGSGRIVGNSEVIQKRAWRKPVDDLLEADFGTTSESALKHNFWIARQPPTRRIVIVGQNEPPRGA